MSNIKSKWYLLEGIFLSLAIVCLAVYSIKPAEAETFVILAEDTFPVDEAGIAAYVKLDSVDITDLTEALNFYWPGEGIKQDKTYVIGVVDVPNTWLWSGHHNYPHLYIGLDGWMVAYYLKDEEASKIMQWNDYQKGAINTTTLQDAIDIMCANIGVTYSSPTDIKYYDFEFPEANKMTLIAEQTECCTWRGSFSVAIPGTLYEASYNLRSDISRDTDLVVNEALIFRGRIGNLYGYYDISTYFQVDMPHFIYFGNARGMATVLIYQN